MFETLNAILGMDVLRYSLLMGSGALLAYTLHPLPSAMDTFASSSILKFGTLFIFGILLAGHIDMSKFLVIFFAALIIIILFEYLRQVDKGLSKPAAVKETAKELMWGSDPTMSYPGAVPYADPRMGIPQFLPDGKTPAVAYSNYGENSNTGDYRSTAGAEHLANPLANTFGEVRRLTTKGLTVAGEMSRGILNAAGIPHTANAEHIANPLADTFGEVRRLTTKGLNVAGEMSRGVLNAAGIKDKERLLNPLDAAFIVPVKALNYVNIPNL